MGYDIIQIPLVIGTLVEPTEHGLLVAMFWVTLIFWSADCPLSLLTGHNIPSGVEYRVTAVAMLYAKTWLIPDLFVVSLDWSFIVLDRSADSSSRTVRTAKVMRILRIARSVRLLRLAKLKRAMEEVQDRIPNEHTRILIEVFKQIGMIVAMAHYIACAWYGIGSSQSEEGGTIDVGWVYRYNLTGRSLGYKYSTSLHWALTQFTPASMEVTPCNSYERFYTLAVLLFAMIVFSTFLSTLTQLTARMRGLAERKDIQISLLRRYMRASDVDAGLQARIKKYVGDIEELETACLKEQDVAFIQVLSRPLRMELKLVTCSTVLAKHPFFAHMSQSSPPALRELCSFALKDLLFCRGDEVFTEGERNDTVSIMFVEQGVLAYHQVQQGSTTLEDGERCASLCLQAKLRHGQWCCEASLWAENWVHMGTLLVCRSCQLVGVCPKEFIRIAEQHTQFGREAVFYAAQFVRRLNATGHGAISDVSQSSLVWLQELLETSLALAAEHLSGPAHMVSGASSVHE
eukprot:NODE_387_length_1609_cov_361.079151.p1 GENE.NODE_387_length_1609_cov_361.079151~~NODE_387_length_1609_cov_361.079151.p1  ORF type:complete len:516 (+),score=223.79 NODE_387_length_1609_cov_361.079151:3-1550(+)